jgi:hypothetical protein
MTLGTVEGAPLGSAVGHPELGTVVGTVVGSPDG